MMALVWHVLLVSLAGVMVLSPPGVLLAAALALLALPHTLCANEVPEVRWISQALAEAMFSFTPSSLTSPECSLHGSLYREALNNSTLWAVEMLDASSVSVGGLLTGNSFSLGHFDQCLSVDVPELRIRGQYCLATLQYGPSPEACPAFYTPPNTTFREPSPTALVWDKVKRTEYPGVERRDEFHWAVCLPASCSPQDLQESLNHSMDTILTKSGLVGSVHVDPVYCRKVEKEQVPILTGYVIIKMALIMYVLIAITATSYDYMIPYFKSQKNENTISEMSEKILLAFSMKKNMKDLTEQGSNPRLDHINGGKVLSMSAVLFGHRGVFTLGGALHNRQIWEQKYENFSDMAILNATHLVDVFFTSAGFLAFLGIYKTLEKNKTINFPLIIFLRWVRIVPPYLLMMGVYGWLMPYMSEGPLWAKRVGLEAKRCRDNWWVNLLFINNYYHAENQCMLLSWYLACDMQMFVFGIFAIYILWRWRKIGFALFGFLLAASILIPFYFTYTGKYSGILKGYLSLLIDPLSNDHYSNVYAKTHNRFGPYVIGVLAAFLSIKLADANYKFSKKIILLGFVVLFGGGYAHQFHGILFYYQDREYKAWENALYAGLHRITFSLGISWIGLICYTTGFGLFRVLFAQPIYTPLCRLLFCLVLVHPAVQLVEASSIRSPEHMNYAKMFWMACGDYMVALLVSLPLYLIVEAPCRTIVKVLFLDRRPQSGNKPSQGTEADQQVTSRL